MGNFTQIRRQLLAGLNEYAFAVTLEHACIDSVVAFGIFLTELGVSCEAQALEEHSADMLCGALSRTVLRLTQAAAEFGPEEHAVHSVEGLLSKMPYNAYILYGVYIIYCRAYIV